ncbi:MAG: macro domain-containing protein [candidate division NC10 bacterium]|nr:macro domain-containing protein [candidate division NC10 bacterium]
MVEIAHGNLLRADAEALVNTVNCVGYMGRGIALQFKKAFPENFVEYQKPCRTGLEQPGKMFVFETGSMIAPRHIINFPTKRHWRGKSRYEDIEAGLKALVSEVKARGIRSIAVPPLGCGLGGLDGGRVRPMIERAFTETPGVRVLLFEPVGAPEAKTMPVGTARPKMTVARASLIELMAQYAKLAYRLMLLEIQKLAYFLQEAGEPLRLRYEAGIYGPYAPNLNKVLEVLEGHFIRGYGDSQQPDVEVELLPGSHAAAEAFLRDRQELRGRLDKVNELISGFETPYGMELLSSVHWVAKHWDPPARDRNSAEQLVASWKARKRQMFNAAHVRVAWDRLADQGWVESGTPS